MEVRFTIPPITPIYSKILDVVKNIRISHIVLINAIIRFFVMSFPSDGGMIFDEVHYIGAARAILQGIAANAEHPPLTKLIIALSIKIFGDFWFAWRFPIVLFSLFVPYIIYKIALKLTDDKTLALYSAAFSCFDIILFIHGNIYMLEFPALVFALGFVYFYLEKRYIISSVMISLGFLCNEKAMLVLLGIAIYHVSTNLTFKSLFINSIRVGKFLTLCVIFGGGGLWLNDIFWRPVSNTSIGIISHETVIAQPSNVTVSFSTLTSLATTTAYTYINDPFSHVFFMINYFSGIQDGIPQQQADWRPPWSWIAPIGANWNKPPIYLESVVSNGVQTNIIISYKAQSTIPLWWMTIPIIILSLLKIKTDNSKFAIAWICGTYVPWFLWELRKQNMPFNHYMMFTIPILCIFVPIFWNTVTPKYRNQFLALHLCVTIIYFFFFFPIGLLRTI